MTDIKPLILKVVPLRFCGQDLTFDLSHALFSSNDIDTGTKLLLKSIAKHAVPEQVSSILDIGCGTGVLGIACARAFKGPDAASPSLLLRDRDALAVEFSLHNARKNKLKAAVGETSLFLEGLGDRRFDLILCNVPAKAGTPVLDSFLRELGGALTARGMAGIVVVNTIAEAALDSVKASGARIVATEKGSGHMAFIFTRAEGIATPSGAVVSSFWQGVERSRGQDTLGTKRYRHAGYFGLPEFDTPSFATELAVELCDIAMTGATVRNTLIINPGSGRLACYLRARSKTRIDLCGRDALANAAARRNILLNEKPSAELVSAEPASAERAAVDSAEVVPSAKTPTEFSFVECAPEHAYDLMLEFPDLIPGVDPGDAFWPSAARALKLGGAVVVSMPSNSFDKLERKKPKGFVKLREKKKKGYVAAAWRLDKLIEQDSGT